LRSVYFHEDDFLQIEILPLENLAFCVKERGAIAEFSDKHRAPDGLGWTDMYCRGDARVPLITLALSEDAVCKALAVSLPPFDVVTTGYSSQVENCKGTRAFGFHADVVIYVDVEESGTVEHAWLGLGGNDVAERAALLQAFKGLAALGKLLVVDWAWGSVHALDDGVGLEEYLLKRQQRAVEVAAELKRQRASRESANPWWKFWG
jgi:hypothetical protein